MSPFRTGRASADADLLLDVDWSLEFFPVSDNGKPNGSKMLNLIYALGMEIRVARIFNYLPSLSESCPLAHLRSPADRGSAGSDKKPAALDITAPHHWSPLHALRWRFIYADEFRPLLPQPTVNISLSQPQEQACFIHCQEKYPSLIYF